MAATPAPLLRDVGRRIAELRVARGWTQDVFAERAEVSVGYIREIEAGHENLSLTSLVKLSTLLGVTVPDLFIPPASRQVRRGRPPKGLAKGLVVSSALEPVGSSGATPTGSGSTPAGRLSTAGSTPAELPTALTPEEELERLLGLAISSVTEQASRGIEWASGLRDVLEAMKKAVHGVTRTGRQPLKGASKGASTRRSASRSGKASPGTTGSLGTTASLGTKAASEFLEKIAILSKKFLGTHKGKSTKKDPKKKAPKRG